MTAIAGIDVRPLAGAMGAEIHGVDLSQPLTPETKHAIRSAFFKHIAVFVPDQHLSPGNICDVVSLFGTPIRHPNLKPVDPDFPFVHELRKEPSQALNYGGEWHMDFSFLEKPLAANSLYARQTPDFGGDTVFINLCMAYDALSDGMKAMLGGMRAVHSVSPGFLAELAANPNRGNMEVKGEALHPVFRTIPETGRKCIYVYPAATKRFEGMTEAESKPIIDFLMRHAERPEFQFRYRWRPDVFGIWDNRCCLHYALNDYPGQTRVMHRMVAMDTVRPY
jgi:taurine dioxygenase